MCKIGLGDAFQVMGQHSDLKAITGHPAMMRSSPHGLRSVWEDRRWSYRISKYVRTWWRWKVDAMGNP